MHERLSPYKRLANCDKAEDIDDLQEELIDRFGELPPQAQSLLATHRVRLLVKAVLRRQARRHQPEQIVVQFSPEFAKTAPIEPIRIINLIQKTAATSSRAGQAVILPSFTDPERQGRRDQELFKQLTS